MALPVAHVAVAFGLASPRDRLALCFLAVLSVAPDFDFFFVWVLGWPMQEFHRTWSHSLPVAAGAALLWPLVRPLRLREVGALSLFLVLASHGFLDLLCTSDPADHGVMWFWPFSTERLGWPVLVPLYLLLADNPFTLRSGLAFSALELVLAAPLWLLARTVRKVGYFPLYRLEIND